MYGYDFKRISFTNRARALRFYNRLDALGYGVTMMDFIEGGAALPDGRWHVYFLRPDNVFQWFRSVERNRSYIERMGVGE